MQNTVFSFFQEPLSLSAQEAFDAEIKRLKESKAQHRILNQNEKVRVLAKLLERKPELIRESHPALHRSKKVTVDMTLDLRTFTKKYLQRKPPYPLLSGHYTIVRFSHDSPKDRYIDYQNQLIDITGDENLSMLIASSTPQSFDECKLREFIELTFSLLEEHPRFKCEKDAERKEFEKWLRPSKCGDPIRDIVMPNVLCALLLEAKYHSWPDKTLTNVQLMTKYYNSRSGTCKEPCECNECANYDICPKPDLSREGKYSFQKFPDVIKKLLGIGMETSGPYEIRTLFPELLATLKDNWSDLPFRTDNMSTNWTQNTALLDSCLKTIAPVPAPDSIMTYYLLELIFRLNTKIRLFLAMYPQKNKDRLSPKVLGKFFFSSPLVYIPDDYIKRCGFSSECFHALIQLSDYWFPVILTALRYYFEETRTFSRRIITESLFPLCGKMECHQLPKPVDLPKLVGEKEARGHYAYNQTWSDFAPSDCFKWKRYRTYTIGTLKKMTSLSSWLDKDGEKSGSSQDKKLKYIQGVLV